MPGFPFPLKSVWACPFTKRRGGTKSWARLESRSANRCPHRVESTAQPAGSSADAEYVSVLLVTW